MSPRRRDGALSPGSRSRRCHTPSPSRCLCTGWLPSGRAGTGTACRRAPVHIEREIEKDWVHTCHNSEEHSRTRGPPTDDGHEEVQQGEAAYLVAALDRSQEICFGGGKWYEGHAIAPPNHATPRYLRAVTGGILVERGKCEQRKPGGSRRKGQHTRLQTCDWHTYWVWVKQASVVTHSSDSSQHQCGDSSQHQCVVTLPPRKCFSQLLGIP